MDRQNGVRLTPAGKRFCAEAGRLASDYQDIVDVCKAVAKTHQMCISFERTIHTGEIDRMLDELIVAFRRACPDVTVRKKSNPDMSLGEALKSGAVDAGFVLNCSDSALAKDFPDVAVSAIPIKEVTDMQRYLWLDDRHPLAKHQTVDVQDLDGCRFLIPSDIRYQSLENLTRIANETTGLKAMCTYWPGSYEECVLNIRSDEAMIVTDSDLKDPAYSSVANRVVVPLTGLQRFLEPGIVYLSENHNPALALLADFVSE